MEASDGSSSGEWKGAICPGAVMNEIRAAVPLYSGIDYNRLDSNILKNGLQWPCRSETDPGTPFLFKGGSFEGKARLIPAEWRENLFSDAYPWVLISGPVVFHSGSLSTRSTGLTQLRAMPWVEINRADAEKLHCTDGQNVILESSLGSITVKAVISNRTAPGVVFMPQHFGLSNRLRGWDDRLTRVNLKKESFQIS